MIFDRTRQDVDEAIQIRAEKVQNGVDLEDADIQVLERGTLTINTLNRIEEKQAELKELFNDIGYWNVPILNKEWTKFGIFNGEDFKRIINNLDILKRAFFVYSSTPLTPIATYNYQTINSIEKILFDLDLMVDDIQRRYKFCGTFNCGEDI